MMEIHILLAGAEIGPFTEAQVHQHLLDGLLSLSDLARYDGMESWETVEWVLASLPQPVAESEPVPLDLDLFPEPETPVDLPPPEPPETQPPVPGPEPMDNTPAFVPLPRNAKRKPKAKPTKRIVIQEILPLMPTPTVAKRTSRVRLAPPLPAEEPAPAEPPPAPPVISPVRALVAPQEVMPPVDPVEPCAPEIHDETPPPAETRTLPPLLPLKSSPRSRRKKKPLLNTPLGPMQPVVVYSAAALVLSLIVMSISAYFLTRPSSLEIPQATTQPKPVAAAPGVAPEPDTVIVPETNPKTAVDFTNRGIYRQSKNDLDGALTDFDTAVGLDPKYALAYYRQGLARQTKGDWTGALAAFNQVLSLDSRHAGAFSNRAFVKQSTGDPDGAIADYTQALLIDPKMSRAYYNRGLIKEQRNDQEGAVLDYNHALDLDPKMELAYFHRANVKNAQSNLDGAIADYTQALTLNPRRDLAYCYRGFARQTKGDFDGALADYTQSLALNPKLAVAYNNRGLIREQKNDLDGAIADSSRAIELDPKYAQSYCNRGLARYGRRNLDGAASDLEAFCQLSPQDPDADYVRLYLWLIATEENPNGHANQELSDALLNQWNSPPGDLSSKIASFLLGRLSEQDLIAATASPDPTRNQALRCKAWYFAAMKRYLAGDKALATNYFRQSVETGMTGTCEYFFAQAKLDELVKTQPSPASH